MTRVKTANGDEIRAILCVAFETNASPEQTQAFTQYLISRQEVLHAAEVEGAFDFMFEASFEHLLRYHEFTGELAQRFASIVRERRASFVCQRYIAGEDRLVWVPHNGHRVRVDLDRIDRATAEGDYVRLHFGGQELLYHATMHALEEALDPRRFIRVHRSSILRLATIAYLRRDEKGWLAECNDGSSHRIARAHWEQLLERVGALSATQGRHSSIPSSSGEKAQVNAGEHRVSTPANSVTSSI